jgi:hypothetical protein
MVNLSDGDVLVFYGGLHPVHDCDHRLIYALMGIYIVKEIVGVSNVPSEQWFENAHVRKTKPGETDIVVPAKAKVSGRFDRCIPIGEWRDRSYRVRQDVLDAWGGLSVKDGFIQRSAVPPALTKPQQFMDWLHKQGMRLIQRNN